MACSEGGLRAHELNLQTKLDLCRTGIRCRTSRNYLLYVKAYGEHPSSLKVRKVRKGLVPFLDDAPWTVGFSSNDAGTMPVAEVIECKKILSSALTVELGQYWAE